MSETEEAPSLLRRLSWDSDYFGFLVGRIDAPNPNREPLLRSCELAANEGYRCLYWLADTSPENPGNAAACDFRFVDLRLQFSIELAQNPSADAQTDFLRDAVPNDLPALRDIAKRTQRDTRFIKDERFPEHLASELYARWIERDVNENIVIVATTPDSESISGFISLSAPDSQLHSQIGLLSVDTQHAGQGIGRALVRAAQQRASKLTATSMSVVTQGSNVSAQRVYQHCGFRTIRADYWFHRWF